MDSQILPHGFGLIGQIWVWVLNPVHFGAIIMPSVLVLIATSVRWAFELPFTSWADALLAFVAFDATVIVDSHNFQAFFSSSNLANYTVGIHLCLLLGAILMWLLLVRRAEKFLVPTHENGRVRWQSFVATGSGVVGVALLLTLHIVTYLSGG